MNEDYMETINGLASVTSEEEFLGKVNANPKKAMKAVKKAAKTTAKAKTAVKKANTTAAAAATVSTVASPTAGSRAEFQARMHNLTADLQEGLKKGKKQLVDATLYNVKSISGNKNIRMFEDSDDKLVGISNVSRAKLEKDEVFLLSGIQLLYGVGASADRNQSNVGAIGWKELSKEIVNGEFTLRAGTQTILDRQSTSVFKNHMIETVGVHGEGVNGFYKLANPKLIRTQEAIDMFLEWAEPAESNAFLKVVLFGSKIMSK